MRITTLIENDTIDSKLKSAHGLSLHIDTGTYKLLVDTGPNNSFVKNAVKLGIDLAEVDMLFITHGHNDHGTGLSKFLKINKKAEVFVTKKAFDQHVKQKGSNYIPIGLKKPKKESRIRYVEDNMWLNDEISLFTKVKYVKQPIEDNSLKVYENKEYIEDHFDHEMYIVIHEKENNVLISGCSHKGIDNIIKTIEKTDNIHLSHVVAGMHFSHYNPFDIKQTDYLQQIGGSFSKRQTAFYACHCTGDEAYFELNRVMKTNLHRIKTGDVINI